MSAALAKNRDATFWLPWHKRETASASYRLPFWSDFTSNPTMCAQKPCKETIIKDNWLNSWGLVSPSMQCTFLHGATPQNYPHKLWRWRDFMGVLKGSYILSYCNPKHARCHLLSTSWQGALHGVRETESKSSSSIKAMKQSSNQIEIICNSLRTHSNCYRMVGRSLVVFWGIAQCSQLSTCLRILHLVLLPKVKVILKQHKPWLHGMQAMWKLMWHCPDTTWTWYTLLVAACVCHQHKTLLGSEY